MKPSRWATGLFIALALGFCIVEAPANEPPRIVPRRLDDDNGKYTAEDFERLLSKLKSERDALDADWKSLSKRLSAGKASSDQDVASLQEQLKQILDRIQRDRPQASKTPAKSPIPIPIPELPTMEPKGTANEGPHGGAPQLQVINQETGAVDLLQLGQTLFRAERYADALTAFRKIELKMRRAEERTPILLMTAVCLHQVGKTDDAIAMLRDAANTRGDERFAGYSQWQLELLRWQRETALKLEDIRQRRLAVEKRP
jgi:tetratricopeptide (TPR) repeat protein